jgi:E1A/CREB-binding protein
MLLCLPSNGFCVWHLPKESDGDIECEIFNTRQQFLSLCQGNHYQFDTTRRTRHSSMMVLYHLHNPSAPAFAGTCNVCSAEIEPGDGYRCSTCDDFDMCKNCQARGVYHEHPLVRQTVSTGSHHHSLPSNQRPIRPFFF